MTGEGEVPIVSKQGVHWLYRKRHPPPRGSWPTEPLKTTSCFLALAETNEIIAQGAFEAGKCLNRFSLPNLKLQRREWELLLQKAADEPHFDVARDGLNRELQSTGIPDDDKISVHLRVTPKEYVEFTKLIGQHELGTSSFENLSKLDQYKLQEYHRIMEQPKRSNPHAATSSPQAEYGTSMWPILLHPKPDGIGKECELWMSFDTSKGGDNIFMSLGGADHSKSGKASMHTNEEHTDTWQKAACSSFEDWFSTSGIIQPCLYKKIPDTDLKDIFKRQHITIGRRTYQESITTTCGFFLPS